MLETRRAQQHITGLEMVLTRVNMALSSKQKLQRCAGHLLARLYTLMTSVLAVWSRLQMTLGRATLPAWGTYITRGGEATMSQGSEQEGCNALWSILVQHLTENGDTSVNIHYTRQHGVISHDTTICRVTTDRNSDLTLPANTTQLVK
jgi:hypothetical protein